MQSKAGLHQFASLHQSAEPKGFSPCSFISFNMSEQRVYDAPNVDIGKLSQNIEESFKKENYETQTFKTQNEGIVVQLKKKGSWRAAVGMSSALTVTLTKQEDNITADIGATKWGDKAVVGAAGALLFPPALITAAYGTWKQSKLPDQIFQVIESYVKNNVVAEDSSSIGSGEVKKPNNAISKNIAKILDRRGISSSDIIIAEEGANGQLILTNSGVLIGHEGLWNKSIAGFTKGEKLILYKNITGVQFKEPGMTWGYVQFTISGGIENRGGAFQAGADENTVTFNKDKLEIFRKIRDVVEEKINTPAVTIAPVQSKTSIADELQKLAELKREGLITDEEYSQLKSQLITKK
jgi:hypothetical protein